MSSLDDKIRKANAMGLSYGYYKALHPDPPSPKPPRKKKKSKRKYTDEQLLDLWKQGKTDAEIGAAVGVSGAAIQKWRDNMEVPCNKNKHIDRSKYELIETEYGIFVICDENTGNK